MAGSQINVYPEKLAAMAEAAGAANAGFLAQTEGINATGSAMELMRVKLEVMMQRLSDGLAPAITAGLEIVGPFIDKIGALATQFAELEPAQQKNIVKILGIVAAVGPALLVLGNLSRGIGGVLSVTRTMAPILGSLVRGIGGLVSMALKAIPALLSFAVANWAALAPILAVVAGIGALIAVGVLVVKHWNKIKAFFVKLWEGIKNIFKAAIDWIRSKLAKIPLIGGLFDGKKDGLFGGRQNPGAAAVNTMASGMTDALPAVNQAGLKVAETVDQYMPHSDAKKGPLSRLTEAGGALMETLLQGALKKPLNLSSVLDSLSMDAGPSGSDSIVINIENLTMQSDDAEDIFSFVRMLKVAGGAA